MALTRQQMDDQVNEHFMYEATDDIDGVVGSFTTNEEIRHEWHQCDYRADRQLDFQVGVTEGRAK